jgi:hypothetical protein
MTGPWHMMSRTESMSSVAPPKGSEGRNGTFLNSRREWYSACSSASATHLATMMAMSSGSKKCTSLVISITMTASESVRRDTPAMKAPAPTMANTPGSIHAHSSDCRSSAVSPAPVAIRTATRPQKRPMQAPMSSMGTKRPEEMQEPATMAAPK